MKKTLLRFSYILVIPRAYHVLLISSCPMKLIKFGKLHIIASYTCNVILRLFQMGKNMAAFWSALQRLPLIVLRWKSRQWVDFKINYALILSLHQQVRRKKAKFYV